MGATTVAVGASTAYAEIAAPDMILPAGTDSVRTVLEVTSATPALSEVYFDSLESYYVDLDVSHAGGQVRIDSLGAHFFNSMIEIFDAGGHAVLTGGGFSGAWNDFIASGGFYNNTFRSGTLGALVPGTTNLPYWSIARTGLATVISAALEADTGVGSGRRVTLTRAVGGSASDSVTVSQHVPVITQFPRGTPTSFTATAHLALQSATAPGGLGARVRIVVTAYTIADVALTSSTGTLSLLPAGVGAHDLSATLLLDETTAYVNVAVTLDDPSAPNQAVVYLYGVEKSLAAAPGVFWAEAAQNRTLTTSPVASSWCLVTLPPGRWLVVGIFDFRIVSTGPDNCIGTLLVGAAVTVVSNDASAAVLGDAGAGTRGTVSQEWIVDVAAGSTVDRSVELAVNKETNAGNAIAGAGHSRLRASPIVT
jgi:hypothetical protein